MNISNVGAQRLILVWWLLKVTYGLLFVVAGADKFINLVTYWEKYISRFVLNILSVESSILILAVGILEIVIGLLILIPGWTKVGATLASVWLLVIALNLLGFNIYYDIAVRDVVMAIGAACLCLLTDVNKELNPDS